MLSSALLLSGCLGSGSEPQAAAEPQLVAQASAEQPAPQAQAAASDTTVEQVVVERESPNIANQIDQLMGRLTLVQEQVINQRALAQQQLELSQAILQRVQLMTNTALIDETKPAAEANAGSNAQSEQLDAALNQLLQIANEMQVNSSQQSIDSPWGVASAVTNKGWILIRYRMDTGESWIAEKGSWTLLKEESMPIAGAYNVQIERRDTDSKGYVAVRLDRSSGTTWWLNDRTWQAY
jgi:PBP1b-binding outer membrane lipoprotein LpoB